MEQQIDILKTGRLSWDIVSRILEETVFEVLRKKIRIKAWAEDKDYWGAIALDYRFSLDGVSYTHLDVYKRQGRSENPTKNHAFPLLQHREHYFTQQHWKCFVA